MKKEKISAIILVVFLVGLSFLYLNTFFVKNISVKAIGGYVSIPKNILNNKRYRLDGEWLAYKYTNDIQRVVTIPTTLNDNLNNSYLIYQLNLKLPKEGFYYLGISYISSAFKLYLNNNLLIYNGIYSTTSNNEVASWQPRLTSFYANEKDVKLDFYVSNHSHYRGGILNSIVLGKNKAIMNIFILNIALELAICVFLISLGIALIFIYSYKKLHDKYFFLGLFCVFESIALSCLGNSSIYFLFPFIKHNIVVKIIHVSFVLSMISLSNYHVAYLNKQSKTKVLLNILNYIYLVYVLLAPVMVFNKYPLVYVLILFTNFVFQIILLLRCLNISKYSKRKVIFYYGNSVLLITVFIHVLNMIYNSALIVSSTNFSIGLFIYVLSQLYIMGIDFKEIFKLSKDAKDYELAFLESQIKPHFLVNTLQSIQHIIKKSPTDANSVIEDLANFMRAKYLLNLNHSLVTLQTELKLVDSYLNIQNKRYSNLINIRKKIDFNCYNYKIPHFLIQTLVENSIKHGFMYRPLYITIEVKIINNDMQICVVDNGRGMGLDLLYKVNNDENYCGAGLRNTRYRLQKNFNTDFVIESIKNVKTKVSFIIPIKEGR